ncbi:MAG: DUF2970 domain-containing protein [Pseudomonadota bacterium]
MSAPVGAPAVERKGSLLHTVRAIAWAFLGIRKNSGYQEDLAKLNPLHVVAVAIVGVVLFIVGLMVLVNWVVAK